MANGLLARVERMLKEAKKAGKPAVPARLQGVSKKRIEQALKQISRHSPDLEGVVYALLDDRPTWFSKAPAGTRFCDGATTAHLACHVGILQRGNGKLDREGRDYWIKPLREVGAIEPVCLTSSGFIAGHPVAKSPSSAYRLAADFADILRAPETEWSTRLAAWISQEAVRQRLALQAKLAEEARAKVDSTHAGLIQQAIQHYVPNFLPGFEVLYVDDSDGDRVSADEKEALQEAGIALELGDAMPDVLLWAPATDHLWVIEAVTSDGEVDSHKVTQIRALAKRSGKTKVGFTTAYSTWRVAAARQQKHKNIAPETYVWIAEDPSKHFLAEAFASRPR